MSSLAHVTARPVPPRLLLDVVPTTRCPRTLSKWFIFFDTSTSRRGYRNANTMRCSEFFHAEAFFLFDCDACMAFVASVETAHGTAAALPTARKKPFAAQ